MIFAICVEGYIFIVNIDKLIVADSFLKANRMKGLRALEIRTF